MKEKPPAANLSWEVVRQGIDWEIQKEFQPDPSFYIASSWKKGATIIPKVLTTVGDIRSGSSGSSRVVTTVNSMHKPYKSLKPLSGDIPVEWISTSLITTAHLLPFHIVLHQREQAILPIDADGALLAHDAACQNKFWAELDSIYKEFRGQGGNTPDTLVGRINHTNGLSTQLPLSPDGRVLVVYPASADIMRSACIPVGQAVMESGLIGRPVDTVEEARYLVSILNAPALMMTFRNSRTSKRHMNTTPWKFVPIPQWNERNTVHRELADLALIAEKSVQSLNDIPVHQPTASKKIREKLTTEGILPEIDLLVGKILPNHTSKT